MTTTSTIPIIFYAPLGFVSAMKSEAENRDTRARNQSCAVHENMTLDAAGFNHDSPEKLNRILTLLQDFLASLYEQRYGSYIKFGMPKASLGIVLYKYVMKYSPRSSSWFNHDRLLLSGCYSGGWNSFFMHLVGASGFMTDKLAPLSQNEKVQSTRRQSAQTIADAVGLAIATKSLSAIYNKPGFDLVNNMLWCVIDDINIYQDIGLEAVSMAGSWKLSNLCVIYDSSCNFVKHEDLNDIKIMTGLKASGWSVIEVAAGTANIEALRLALNAAKASELPTFVNIQHPKSLARPQYTIRRRGDEDNFSIPQEIYDFFRDVGDRGSSFEADWVAMLKAYERRYPTLATEFRLRLVGEEPKPSIKNGPGWHSLGTEPTTLTGTIRHLSPPISEHQALPEGRLDSWARVRATEHEQAKTPVSLRNSQPANASTLHIRPCDPEETTGAFLVAIRSTQIPTTISLPKQGLSRSPERSSRWGVTRGAYVFVEADDKDFHLTLISTGSGMNYAMRAREILCRKHGLKVRAVSCPCLDLFKQQSEEYRLSVLKPQYGKPTVVLDTDENRDWEPYADALVLFKRVQIGAAGHAKQASLMNQVPEIVSRIRSFVEEFRRDHRT
ncbi:hypothetical protein ACJZ2D_015468 [Fusarium nematophilum]